MSACSMASALYVASRGLFIASLAAEAMLFPVSAIVFSRVTFAGLALNFLAIPMMGVAQIAGMLVLPAAIVSGALAFFAGWVAHAGAAGLVWSADLVRFVPARDVSHCAAVMGCRGHLLPRARSLHGRYGVDGSNPAARKARAERGRGGSRPPPRLVPQSGSSFPFHCLRERATAGCTSRSWTSVRAIAHCSVSRGARRCSSTREGWRAREVRHRRSRRGARPSRCGSATTRPPGPDPRRPRSHRRGSGRRSASFGLARSGRGFQSHRSALSSLCVFRRSQWMRNGRTSTAAAGSSVDGVEIRAIHPPPADWERQKVRNDDSVMLDCSWRDVSVLLTGDIGRAVEGRWRETPSRRRSVC